MKVIYPIISLQAKGVYTNFGPGEHGGKQNPQVDSKFLYLPFSIKPGLNNWVKVIYKYFHLPTLVYIWVKECIIVKCQIFVGKLPTSRKPKVWGHGHWAFKKCLKLAIMIISEIKMQTHLNTFHHILIIL